jgi:4-amino-4-deoxy-L-arabinose transferase-like glycosyltransferase
MPDTQAVHYVAEVSLHRYTPVIRRICVMVFCLTVALTLGQGLLRYRHVLGKTGAEFVELNQYDALLHVTLAERIMAGLGDTLPTTSADGPIGSSQPAFEKAPGYPFLLAVLFRITGVGFAFFPLQCLIGGLLSVLVVLVATEAFGDPSVALFAGIAAAVHPVLVNAASQLYNENIYFFLFFLCVWLYLRWYRNPSTYLALLCGICAGLTALIREAVFAPFAALVLLAFVWNWRKHGMASIKPAAIMAAGLILVVAPWTVRNYVVSGGEFVPISTTSWALVGSGNNDCVAAEGWGTPFYGDDPCPSLNQERTALLASRHEVSTTATRARAFATLGKRWIASHPGAYLKLCIRRAWTVFDPLHPQQHLTGANKLVMVSYFVVFVYTGVIGAVWVALRARKTFQILTLYVLILAMYVPMVLLFVSHDHRFAIGIHLLLACFAGAWLAHLGAFSFLERNDFYPFRRLSDSLSLGFASDPKQPGTS